jgi:multiple sugar transport system ATP-binding protein
MNLLETSNVIAGFRPEHLHPAGTLPREEPALRVAFRTSHEEYLGAERILYGVIEGGPFDGKKAVARMSSTLAARFAPDTVHDFAVAESDMKFFDRANGTRTGPATLA